MPRILYGISPIGLGHAARSFEVVRRLAAAGVDVRAFSGGKVVDFLGAQGLRASDLVSDSSPAVSSGVMKRASTWYIRSWLSLRRNSGAVRRICEELRPDLVVCDEEFSGMAAAERVGLKRVFISDELELGFARSWFAHRIEERVYRWYKRLQEEVDLLIIPEDGVDSGNRRYVGPIVRAVTEGASDVRRRHGLPEEGPMVLLSLSGSGLGDFLVQKTILSMKQVSSQGAFLAVVGNRRRSVSAEAVFDIGLVPDNQNLVAAADLVVSTAGKSTIDEARAAGTPMIAIPIRNHAEQERNAAALGYSHDDLGRLPELMRLKLGRRSEPHAFRGAEAAALAILAELRDRRGSEPSPSSPGLSPPDSPGRL